MANNLRDLLFHLQHSKKTLMTSVSLLGLLATTASFSFQQHPVSSMFQTFSGLHPLISSLDCSFQLSSVCGLTSASSSAMVIVEMLCVAFLKHSNHPLEATKPSTCSFSAITKLPLRTLSQRLEYWRTFKDNTTLKLPRECLYTFQIFAI